MGGGGKHCTIVGCGGNSMRCRGLSFHKLPAKGKSDEQDLWRRRLIIAIDRHDERFNEDTAVICSRHFESDCFEMCGVSKRLKPFFLPTLHMPQHSISAVSAGLQEEPVTQYPPAIPSAAYCSLEELKADSLMVMLDISGWYVRGDKDEMSFIFLEREAVKLRLTVNTELQNKVFLNGKLHKYAEDSVRTKGLKCVLNELQRIKCCPGIVCDHLQKYASIRCTGNGSSTEKYHRKIFNALPAETANSSVFSDNCLGVQKTDGPCRPCNVIKDLLMRKHKRATADRPIHLNTSLSKLKPEAMVSLLEEYRKENKALQAQLKK